MAAESYNADFFVSYNHQDESWAEWIADVLEASGYTVIVQKWDFRPGQNFALEMHRAAIEAERTILVLSKSSLASDFTAPEWAAAFVNDPAGSQAKLVPVRIDDCEPDGLLRALIYIELNDLDEEAATRELLVGVGSDRRKPSTKVPFPGSPPNGQPAEIPSSAFPSTSPSLGGLWQPIDAPPSVAWQRVDQGGFISGHGTSLEIHLVPTTAQRLEVRKIASLANELISAGRQSGLFDNVAELTPETSSELSMVQQVATRDRGSSGLIVTRSGDRGAWITLPRDSLGAIFDPAHVGPQLEAVLATLISLTVDTAERYAVAAAITEPMMLKIGRVSEIGNRSSVSGIGLNTADVVLEPEDAVSIASLRNDLHDVVDEIVARLQMRLGGRH